MDGEWVVPGFRHVRELGRGGAGTVVLAVPAPDGAPVAIKYLAPSLLNDEAFLNRFRDEARLLAQLQDPNLVQFYDYVEALPHGAAIIMELVEGVTLATIINTGGPTTPEGALVVLKGSLMGLSAAHRLGIVHRDYKPGNVLVDGTGASKLSDFGIAVRAGDGAPAAGSPSYMAPEQWHGHPVTAATDVYAATVVFFECLTGERPFRAATIPLLALAHRDSPIPEDRVPEAIRPLVVAGLAKDPAERPDSASAFLGRLEALALAAYGVGWEERGRTDLAERALLLALLFPLAQPLFTGATAPAISGLGPGSPEDAQQTQHAQAGMGHQAVAAAGGAGRRTFWFRRTVTRRWRAGAVMAACGALLLAVAGTGVVVYAASKDDKPGKKTPPSAAGPAAPSTGLPPAGGSEPPTASPSTTPTTGSPSPSPFGSTSAPNTAVGGGLFAPGDPTGGGPGNPPPRPPTGQNPPRPTSLRVTGLSISWDRTRSGASGSYTVRTNGTGSFTVTISYSGGEGPPGRTDSLSGSTSYTRKLDPQSGRCSTLTVTVSPSIGGAESRTVSPDDGCGVG